MTPQKHKFTNAVKSKLAKLQRKCKVRKPVWQLYTKGLVTYEYRLGRHTKGGNNLYYAAVVGIYSCKLLYSDYTT